jgi:hypothetical protein
MARRKQLPWGTRKAAKSQDAERTATGGFLKADHAAHLVGGLLGAVEDFARSLSGPEGERRAFRHRDDEALRRDQFFEVLTAHSMVSVEDSDQKDWNKPKWNPGSSAVLAVRIK